MRWRSREREIIDFAAIMNATNYRTKYNAQRTIIHSTNNYILRAFFEVCSQKISSHVNRRLSNTTFLLPLSLSLSLFRFNCFPINYSEGWCRIGDFLVEKCRHGGPIQRTAVKNLPSSIYTSWDYRMGRVSSKDETGRRDRVWRDHAKFSWRESKRYLGCGSRWSPLIRVTEPNHTIGKTRDRFYPIKQKS